MWTAGLHSALDEHYSYDAVLIGSSTVLMMEAESYSETSENKLSMNMLSAQKNVIKRGTTQMSISPNNVK